MPANVSRSVHQRLLNLRDKTGEPFNHLLMRFGLERLLYRIQVAGHADLFTLKGAMLFALWHDVPGRPTRDVDFLGKGNLTHERLRNIFSDACNAVVLDDGLRFDAGSIQTEDIREGHEYHGIRVYLAGYLESARLAMQADIGFGDTALPTPEAFDYPSLLDFPSPRLRAYHPSTVVAEKLSAVILLGFFNSRMKDFYDMYVILKYMNIDEALLKMAIDATFKRRGISVGCELPITFTPAFLEDGSKNIQWLAFLRRSQLASDDLHLADVLAYLQSRLQSFLMT